jgi:Ala-tRNA(Pro) deacylase
MALPESLNEYLRSNGIDFRHHLHPEECIASRVADLIPSNGGSYAKTVIARANGSLIMAVIPARERLDLRQLSDLTAESNVRLATEREISRAFPDCAVGAAPALGSLYGLPVWLDRSFEDRRTIAFDGGTYVDSIEIDTSDFRRLVSPRIAWLTETHGFGSRRF